MTMWHGLAEAADAVTASAVTVGNFDGVHRGHRAVIAEVCAAAHRLQVPAVAVTFEPHPMAVLRPDHAPSMLSSLDERAEELVRAGIDHVLALPFDREIAAWSPQEFVDRILVEALHAQAVVVGANFRFGSRAAGDVGFLVDAGHRAGFEARGVELDGGPQVWSSTYIRTCLAAGDVAGAAEALGRPFAVTGPVVRGDQRGRELGYPTANVMPGPGRAVPADGVYAGWLLRRDTGERLPTAISVGTNPTFNGQRERRVEAYVLDRTDLELYGVVVEVSFLHRLRGMVAFDGVDALVAQMADDVSRARELLTGSTPD